MTAVVEPGEGGGVGGDVLIVDDQPASLAMLAHLLAESGFKVRAVNSGDRALEAARLRPPDCVLLDVAMPGTDGFAVCAAFQADPLLREIPIIFLTAHDDTEHKVRAFAAGGRDYVAKPFAAAEVLARVGNQLRIRDLERQQRRHNEQLVESNSKLTEAAALRAGVTAMLVHDIRSPLSVIHAFLGELPPSEGLTDATIATKRIAKMLTEMLELARAEGHGVTCVETTLDVTPLVAQAVRLSSLVAAARGITLRADLAGEPLRVLGDARELERVLENLLGNAIRYTPAGGSIEVRVTKEPGGGVERGLTFASITVADSGPGIRPEDLPYIFDPYRQAAGSSGQGVGLGLAIVARIVARHHGRVRVLSQMGVGTEFVVLLPM